MSIVIFDLDGTLALIQHRRHFVEGDKKDWDSFHKACVDDLPNKPIIEIWDLLANHGHEMWIFSGRNDLVDSETEDWLYDNGLFPHCLRMRDADDRRPDTEIKLEWLNDMSPEQRSDILCVFDDRQRLVNMWREQGLTCLQVAPGNF